MKPLRSNHHAALLTLALLLLSSGACRREEKAQPGGAAKGVIIVNAPAAGVVQRIMVTEGARVAAGATIIEIAVRGEEMPAGATAPGESPAARAARDYRAADAEVEAARAEVVRYEAEVERLTPLVAAGQASPGELDGARALYERAQQRLRRAQDAARRAETGLSVAQRPGGGGGGGGDVTPPAPREQIRQARTASAGTVSAISVRAGESVSAGQPIATLRSVEP